MQMYVNTHTDTCGASRQADLDPLHLKQARSTPLQLSGLDIRPRARAVALLTRVLVTLCVRVSHPSFSRPG